MMNSKTLGILLLNMIFVTNFVEAGTVEVENVDVEKPHGGSPEHREIKLRDRSGKMLYIPLPEIGHSTAPQNISNGRQSISPENVYYGSRMEGCLSYDIKEDTTLKIRVSFSRKPAGRDGTPTPTYTFECISDEPKI